jgi:hypothetical protein
LSSHRDWLYQIAIIRCGPIAHLSAFGWKQEFLRLPWERDPKWIERFSMAVAEGVGSTAPCLKVKGPS